MKYLILGAGPAGLVMASRLKQIGKDSVLVLEREREAGGLCRSCLIDEAPFDIGGGHFLDAYNSKAVKYLFEYMPENEWNLYQRDSRISINGYLINSPIESNIWQMNLDDQIEYLKSIAIAGCNIGCKMPEKFIDWIDWKLGEKIATEYMLPYNKKMFADELNELGTYWLDKLPDVSFEETLKGCLTRRSYGKQPGHTQFFYPKKHGFGEVWMRMADSVRNCICYESVVESIDFIDKKVRTADGEVYSADIIINTIPWKEFKELKGMPNDLVRNIAKLKHSSIETRYFSEMLNTKAQWIYYPELLLPYHRILVRHNFCPGSRGYWSETRKERIEMFPENNRKLISYMNEYAYPLNTIEKPVIMEELLRWCENHQVYALGRWGEHQHYNSDVVVNRALNFAEKL